MDSAQRDLDMDHRSRLAVFYTHGQNSTCAGAGDLSLMTSAFESAGFEVEVLDLADLARDEFGGFLLRNQRTGAAEPWRVPGVAVMYHGAIGPDDAVELLVAIEEAGCSVINGSEAWPIFTDKLLFARYMGERGVRVIPTQHVTSVGELHDAVDLLGGEAVVKKAISTEGDDIFVVRDLDDVERVGAWLPRLGGELIVQPIVDARVTERLEPEILAHLLPDELDRRHEFRVHTSRRADGSISIDACYMRVAPNAEQVVNNCAQGARATAVAFGDLHVDDQRTVFAAAQLAPPGGDLIGWDLIGQPGERRIIEGNSGSGLPNGDEGIDPMTVIRQYVLVASDAATRSETLQPV